MPEVTLARKRGKAKMKIATKRKAVMERIAQCDSGDPDMRIALIRELIPLGLEAVAEKL